MSTDFVTVRGIGFIEGAMLLIEQAIETVPMSEDTAEPLHVAMDGMHMARTILRGQP